MTPAKVGAVPRLPPWSYQGNAPGYPFTASTAARSWAGRLLGGDRSQWPLVWSADSAAQSWGLSVDAYVAAEQGKGGSVFLPKGFQAGYRVRRPRAVVWQDIDQYFGQYGWGFDGQQPVRDAVQDLAPQLADAGVFGGRVNTGYWQLFGSFLPHEDLTDVADPVSWGSYTTTLPTPAAEKFVGGECLVIRSLYDLAYFAYTITWNDAEGHYDYHADDLNNAMAQDAAYLEQAARRFDRLNVHVIYWSPANATDPQTVALFNDYQAKFLLAAGRAPACWTYDNLGALGTPGVDSSLPYDGIKNAALTKIKSFYGL
jgi:hypothetical protein